jgi:ABC-2 type transport system ATP-binding protein
MENILEVKNLTKMYKGFTLDNVSFSLPYGYILGLIGPNGAGKTTIIKCIMNLLQKSAGQIHIFGLDYQLHEVAIKQRIGFVYDQTGFYDHLTLKQMKNVIAPFYQNWNDSAFDHYIKDFELPLQKKIRQLSKGMQLKYALAIALSHQAELIIMDEPTSGLDPIFRRELLEILRDLIQDEHKSILFSTHITSDLERVADYITFIKDGKLVFNETKDHLLENWSVIKGDKRLVNQESLPLLSGVRFNEYGFEALTANAVMAKKFFKEEAVYEKATLEDIMFYTIKGEQHA